MIPSDVTATGDAAGFTALRTAIRAFVSSTFYLPAADALRDDSSLLEAGIIDSTGVLEIIGFVEATYGVRVADEDIVPENLDSIDNISRYVLRKRGS